MGSHTETTHLAVRFDRLLRVADADDFREAPRLRHRPRQGVRFWASFCSTRSPMIRERRHENSQIFTFCPSSEIPGVTSMWTTAGSSSKTKQSCSWTRAGKSLSRAQRCAFRCWGREQASLMPRSRLWRTMDVWSAGAEEKACVSMLMGRERRETRTTCSIRHFCGQTLTHGSRL